MLEIAKAASEAKPFKAAVKLVEECAWEGAFPQPKKAEADIDCGCCPVMRKCVKLWSAYAIHVGYSSNYSLEDFSCYFEKLKRRKRVSADNAGGRP